jgi:hypothetical protein
VASEVTPTREPATRIFGAPYRALVASDGATRVPFLPWWLFVIGLCILGTLFARTV